MTLVGQQNSQTKPNPFEGMLYDRLVCIHREIRTRMPLNFVQHLTDLAFIKKVTSYEL